ncbi:endonuclease/exonuclease/phosphatase family protein [Streptomyces sp. NPDC012888]|uniref:endonuclease/exonuclease/phosphatase family protein n=1 Tax=Streptomyces sp. NPDC012888 TaxID=3364855 RepID=UPI00369A10AE
MLAAAFAAVCATQAAGPAQAAGESMPVAEYRAWHWNVAGSTFHGGSTQNGMVTAAVGSIRAQDPDFVSFNEICRTQYDEILRRLAAPYGDSGPWTRGAVSYARFATSRQANTGICQGEAFGNAIFSRHELGVSQTYVLPPDYTPEEALQGPVEDRTLLCAPLKARPKMKFCTTHITGSNRPMPTESSAKINKQQLDAVSGILDGFAQAGQSYLLAGDLNAQPHPDYVRLDKLMEAHTELDSADDAHCPGYGEWTAVGTTGKGCVTNGTNPKIDFILARTGQMDGTFTADAKVIPETCEVKNKVTGVVESLRPCSDHRVLIGSAHLRVSDATG